MYKSNTEIEQVEKFTLNPICSGFIKYRMRWIHEPYFNFMNEISWRSVPAPEVAYVKNKDINDKNIYNLTLRTK